MTAEFISTSDRRWSDFLATCRHDVYHLPAYLELMAHYEGGEPVAFYAQHGDAKFLAPMLVRRLPEHLQAPDEWRDAITPYGYPTPLLSRGDERALVAFIDAFQREGRSHELVTAFFRLHPLIPLPPGVLEFFGDRHSHGRTVYIDLCRPSERLWAETHRSHRNRINKLGRMGYRATMDEWEYYPSYIDIYRKTMQRLGASDFYHFSESYFHGLKEALGSRLHLCTVVAPDGEVAAAGTFTESRGLIQYHLGGTSESHLFASPSKLFLHHVRLWAKERGCHTFHLGGGVGASSDSLFKFKAGFAATTANFSTFRMIIDEERYQQLAPAAPPPAAAADGYFPSYRHSAGVTGPPEAPGRVDELQATSRTQAIGRSRR